MSNPPEVPGVDPDELKMFSFQVWSYKQGEMVSTLTHLGEVTANTRTGTRNKNCFLTVLGIIGAGTSCGDEQERNGENRQ